AVNRDMSEDIELTCDLRAFGSLRIGEHILLHHDDCKAVNTEAAPHNVQPTQMSGEQDRLDGGKLTVVLPSLSWNVIRLV
ncbi:MAG: alpha-N-arabinofuranosidase, partial [Clostridia bacterium]